MSQSIILSIGPILAGIGALVTAFLALKRVNKSTDVDTSAATLDVVEKFFQNQTMINEFLLDRIQQLEKKTNDK